MSTIPHSRHSGSRCFAGFARNPVQGQDLQESPPPLKFDFRLKPGDRIEGVGTIGVMRSMIFRWTLAAGFAVWMVGAAPAWAVVTCDAKTRAEIESILARHDAN